jgi:hypothetical protein
MTNNAMDLKLSTGKEEVHIKKTRQYRYSQIRAPPHSGSPDQVATCLDPAAQNDAFFFTVRGSRRARAVAASSPLSMESSAGGRHEGELADPERVEPAAAEAVQPPGLVQPAPRQAQYTPDLEQEPVAPSPRLSVFRPATYQGEYPR